MNPTTVAVASSPEVRDVTAWPAVVSLSIGVFGLVTAEFLPPSLLTPMSRDLHIPLGVAGQAVTVTALVAAVSGPLVVVLTKRFDRRTTLLGLLLCLVISSLAAAMAGNVEVLFFARALLGLGLGGFWALSVALAIRLASRAAVARAVAVMMTGVSVATVCAAPLGAWISATLGWRFAFYLTALLGVLALLTQLSTTPKLPPTEIANFSSFGAILKRPAIRTMLLATCFIIAGHFAAFTYVRPYLETGPRLGAKALSLFLLAFGVAGFFGNLLGGALAQKSARLTIAGSAAGIALATLVAVFAGNSHFVALAAVSVWGLAFGAYPVSAQTFLTEAAPTDAEGAGALQLTVYMAAVSAGAIIGGTLLDRFGPASTFMFAGASSFLGALLIGRDRFLPKALA